MSVSWMAILWFGGVAIGISIGYLASSLFGTVDQYGECNCEQHCPVNLKDELR